jgi:hypothetical protein
MPPASFCFVLMTTNSPDTLQESLVCKNMRGNVIRVGRFSSREIALPMHHQPLADLRIETALLEVRHNGLIYFFPASSAINIYYNA